jgi:hypothetical protein
MAILSGIFTGKSQSLFPQRIGKPETGVALQSVQNGLHGGKKSG